MSGPGARFGSIGEAIVLILGAVVAAAGVKDRKVPSTKIDRGVTFAGVPRIS